MAPAWLSPDAPPRGAGTLPNEPGGAPGVGGTRQRDRPMTPPQHGGQAPHRLGDEELAHRVAVGGVIGAVVVLRHHPQHASPVGGEAREHRREVDVEHLGPGRRHRHHLALGTAPVQLGPAVAVTISTSWTPRARRTAACGSCRRRESGPRPPTRRTRSPPRGHLRAGVGLVRHAPVVLRAEQPTLSPAASSPRSCASGANASYRAQFKSPCRTTSVGSPAAIPRPSARRASRFRDDVGRRSRGRTRGPAR